MSQQTAAPVHDYQQLALESVIAAENLCAGISIPAGARVLDLGTGTGHAAIAAARRRARVIGIDIDEHSLARARVRAEAEGVADIDFLAADALALPFEDASFDIVLSTLGVVFLPDHSAAVKAVARVVRPGGTIALTAYTRHSIPSQVYDLVNGLVKNPLAPAFPHYMWSDGAHAGELLTPYFHNIRIQYASYDTCFASAEASFDHVARWNPNIAVAMQRGAPELVAQLREGYVRILQQHNRATDGSFMANMDYAVITAVRSA